MEQQLFIEELENLKIFAKSNGDKVTKSDVLDCIGHDAELDDAKWQMVAGYLKTNGIELTDVELTDHTFERQIEEADKRQAEKELNKEGLETYYEELGTTLGEALLAPTRIYVKALKAVKNAGVTVKACSHITGGGFYENIPRMLIDGKRAVVEKDSYPVLPIFKLLAEKGNIEEHMMYNTYNMGLGMILAVDPADVDKTMEAIRKTGDKPYVVGSIEEGEKGVTLC